MTERYNDSQPDAQPRLSRERLAWLLSVYGGNTKRWPEDLRNLSLKDLGLAPDLFEQLAAESELDDALDSVRVVRIPDQLREQLLAAFDRFEERQHARISRRVARLASVAVEAIWPGAPRWQLAFALSLSVAIGASAGLAIPDPIADFGDQQVANVSDTPAVVDVDPGQ